MKRPYLEVTFRKGKALAAYLHLPRANGAKAVRSDARPRGLVVDFTASGEPFGVEITAPALVDLDALNESSMISTSTRSSPPTWLRSELPELLEIERGP